MTGPSRLFDKLWILAGASTVGFCIWWLATHVHVTLSR